eukprot:1885741-Pyramimonas_sp.AAC.3
MKPHGSHCGMALHTSLLVGTRRVVVFGGRGCNLRQTNALCLLDSATLSWSQPETCGDIPSPRESHSAVMISTSAMVVVGGTAGNVWLNDAFILDVDNWRWTRIEMNPVSCEPQCLI